MQTSNSYTWLDRDQTEMPSNYLPEASGVAIAGDALLRAVGYHPGSKRPLDWFKKNSGVFRYREGQRRLGGIILQVRQAGTLWVIERYRDGDWLDPAGRPGLNIYALVCTQTDRPIWTPSYQAAMHLAQYCHPVVRPPVIAHWVPAHEREHAQYVAEYERATRQRLVAGSTG
jgi:hypothetical protein